MDALIVALITVLTAPIPVLASSGILLLAFVCIWVAFAIAAVRAPARIDAAWARLRRLPLVVQGVAWLLALPVLAGVWVWRRRAWPTLGRTVLVGAIAAWNLLVLVPA